MNLIEASAFSFSKEKGRVNQDAILSPQKINGNYLFAVADGVGSYVGGEQVSGIAVKQLLKIYSSGSEPSIHNVFNEIRKKVVEFSRSDSQYYKAATTLTYVYLTERGIYIGHIGDCRVYVKNEKKLDQLTKDHTQYQRLVEGKIFTKKYLEDKRAKSILTTAIAQDINMEYDTIYLPYEKLPLEEGSVTFYIMSDGLHSFWERRPRFSDKTMGSVVQFSNSIKRRVEYLGAIDDYSLVGLKVNVVNL